MFVGDFVTYVLERSGPAGVECAQGERKGWSSFASGKGLV